MLLLSVVFGLGMVDVGGGVVICVSGCIIYKFIFGGDFVILSGWW